MSGASSRRAGLRWEVAVANYLSDMLGLDVRTQRSVTGGLQDGPDLVCVDENGHVSRTIAGWIVECKNHRRIDLSGWVDQADHGGPFAVVVKRRQKPVGEAYVLMPLRVFSQVVGSVSQLEVG